MTELTTLVAVPENGGKISPVEQGRGTSLTEWKARSVASISFSETALIRKRCVGQTACEKLLRVAMRLYVKY